MLELAYWLIGIGLAFDLFGCIGLVRLPDVYNRAQAATKCVTLGTCLILAGVAVAGFGQSNWSMGVKALICAVFVLVTSPVAAHAISRGAYLSGVPLWKGSVEDALARRIATPDARRESKGTVEGEKTKTT